MSQTLQPQGFGGAGVDDAIPEVVRSYKVAGTAVGVRDLVSFIAVTDATAEVTVEQTDVSDAAPLLIAGVALEDGAVGDYVRVCRAGICLVNIGDASITAGQSAGLHATTDGAADNADATEGSFGTFLSAHDVGGTNVAVVDVRLSSRAPDA